MSSFKTIVICVDTHLAAKCCQTYVMPNLHKDTDVLRINNFKNCAESRDILQLIVEISWNSLQTSAAYLGKYTRVYLEEVCEVHYDKW